MVAQSNKTRKTTSYDLIQIRTFNGIGYAELIYTTKIEGVIVAQWKSFEKCAK